MTGNHRIQLDRIRIGCVTVVLIVGVTFLGGCRKNASSGSGWKHKGGKTVKLNPPQKSGGPSLYEILNSRRSRREFSSQTLSEEQISQLCWAGQGITAESNERTAPSAGALNPITILVADRSGVREYLPEMHALRSRGDTDVRKKLQAAALNQSAIGDAPACFIVTFDAGKTAKKYGGEAERYCLLESGHVAQNILLTAQSLKLAAVPIGAANANRVSKLLGLPSRLEAVYLIPVGHPK